MPKLEIAGMTVSYNSAPDLPLKVGEALKETQRRRAYLENEVKQARRQERQLLKFLGQRRRSAVPAVILEKRALNES